MTKVIILAAGKGTRMGQELPKVLNNLGGRPMISRLLDSVLESGITDKPLLIVSPSNQEMIRVALKDYDLDYAIQDEPLGTGQAVSCAREHIFNRGYERVIVLYGDHPFISVSTLKNLVASYQYPLAMLTVVLEDFNDWRIAFTHWGRIVRRDSHIERIVEYKDANDEERNIKEVFPAVFCFSNDWLWENLPNVRNNNQKKEYYLTDLVRMATAANFFIPSLKVDPCEGIGVNTPEELVLAKQLISKR